MKILFLSGGGRERALKFLIDKGEEIVAVVVPRLTEKNRKLERVICAAVEGGIPVFPTTKACVTSILAKFSFDILVSCGFPYLLEKKAIESVEWAINVHPTLLPKYRGARSGPYVILNGEIKTGVTVHLMTLEMDQGDILGQKEFFISPFDTPKSLFRKAQEVEPELLYTVLQEIKAKKISRTPQIEEQATVFNYLRTPKDSEIDWNKSLRALYNEIRACDPLDYPAFFYVEGQKVCVKMWRSEKAEDDGDMI